MQILTIESREIPSGWRYSKVELGKINLVVGDSGTGKTRFLNTIFNLGSSAVAKEFVHAGYWDITIRQSGQSYRWILETRRIEQRIIITSDNISRLLEDGQTEKIIERDQNHFKFLGKDLPKLSPNVASISLLKEEEVIEPLFRGFSNIIRRKFMENALENVSEYQAFPVELFERIGREKDLEKIFQSDFKLNVRLYILSEFFKDIYNTIVEFYKSVFPFITDVRIIDFNVLHKDAPLPGKIPVFCVREKYVQEWIELGKLSSGMQKVLLILTDTLMSPEGAIYLIDEYENSLGMNAIDFFPNFLLTHERDNQFIITSHHPYIINNIPFENWLVLHRKGAEVTIKYGNEIKERFGKSRQDAFIQLINDSFYREGVE